MTAIIDNLTDKMLFVSLTDGRTLDLSPQVCPVSVSESELRVNVKIKKLLARGVIRLVSKEILDKTDDAVMESMAELKVNDKLDTEKLKRVKKKSAPSTNVNE